VVGLGQREQLARVGDAAGDPLERGDDGFQGLLFLAELLRTLRVVPQPGVFELAIEVF